MSSAPPTAPFLPVEPCLTYGYLLETFRRLAVPNGFAYIEIHFIPHPANAHRKPSEFLGIFPDTINFIDRQDSHVYIIKLAENRSKPLIDITQEEVMNYVDRIHASMVGETSAHYAKRMHVLACEWHHATIHEVHRAIANIYVPGMSTMGFAQMSSVVDNGAGDMANVMRFIKARTSIIIEPTPPSNTIAHLMCARYLSRTLSVMDTDPVLQLALAIRFGGSAIDVGEILLNGPVAEIACGARDGGYYVVVTNSEPCPTKNILHMIEQYNTKSAKYGQMVAIPCHYVQPVVRSAAGNVWPIETYGRGFRPSNSALAHRVTLKISIVWGCMQTTQGFWLPLYDAMYDARRPAESDLSRGRPFKRAATGALMPPNNRLLPARQDTPAAAPAAVSAPTDPRLASPRSAASAVAAAVAAADPRPATPRSAASAFAAGVAPADPRLATPRSAAAAFAAASIAAAAAAAVAATKRVPKTPNSTPPASPRQPAAQKPGAPRARLPLPLPPTNPAPQTPAQPPAPTNPAPQTPAQPPAPTNPAPQTSAQPPAPTNPAPQTSAQPPAPRNPAPQTSAHSPALVKPTPVQSPTPTPTQTPLTPTPTPATPMPTPTPAAEVADTPRPAATLPAIPRLPAAPQGLRIEPLSPKVRPTAGPGILQDPVFPNHQRPPRGAEPDNHPDAESPERPAISTPVMPPPAPQRRASICPPLTLSRLAFAGPGASAYLRPPIATSPEEPVGVESPRTTAAETLRDLASSFGAAANTPRETAASVVASPRPAANPPPPASDTPRATPAAAANTPLEAAPRAAPPPATASDTPRASPAASPRPASAFFLASPAAETGTPQRQGDGARVAPRISFVFNRTFADEASESGAVSDAPAGASGAGAEADLLPSGGGGERSPSLGSGGSTSSDMECEQRLDVGCGRGRGRPKPKRREHPNWSNKPKTKPARVGSPTPAAALGSALEALRDRMRATTALRNAVVDEKTKERLDALLTSDQTTYRAMKHFRGTDGYEAELSAPTIDVATLDSILGKYLAQLLLCRPTHVEGMVNALTQKAKEKCATEDVLFTVLANMNKLVAPAKALQHAMMNQRSTDSKVLPAILQGSRVAHERSNVFIAANAALHARLDELKDAASSFRHHFPKHTSKMIRNVEADLEQARRDKFIQQHGGQAAAPTAEPAAPTSPAAGALPPVPLFPAQESQYMALILSLNQQLLASKQAEIDTLKAANAAAASFAAAMAAAAGPAPAAPASDPA